MTKQKLGQLEEVDLRTIWGDESRDFTPWLAARMDQLGEALGLDLQLIESEAGVGPFAVDILASEDEVLVVIENQLERTDHGHLGQLLTYAAGRDARTLIWITPDFRDEHRAALDWLNRWTSEQIKVFGVEVRAVRIGDSLPAPEFRAVAFPNTWSRQSSRATSDGSRGEQYREFFQPVVEHLHGLGLTHRRNATTQGYQVFRVEPRAILGVGLDYNLRCWSDGSLGVKLHLADRNGTTENRLRIYDNLVDQRETIEKGLGHSLHWDRFESWSYSQVQAVRTGSVDDSDYARDGHRQWMKEELPRLVEVLSPYLKEAAKALDAEQSDAIDDGLPGNDGG